MKTITRIITAVLLMLAMTASAAAAYGAGIPAGGERMSAFLSFTGTVVEWGDSPGRFITLENEDGSIVNFVQTDETFVAEGAVLEPGATVTGWYDASLPVIMIYPPQYTAVAFAAYTGEPPFVKLDRFDENLLSYSGDLRLNVSEETPIILQDGSEFDLFGQTPQEALANRVLMVFYSITTRSIPPQTPPELIVVFFERAVPPIHILTPEELEGFETEEPDYSWVELIFPPLGTPVPLVVEGTPVGEVGLQYTPQGIVFVPLYIVAEALGIEITWDESTRSVVWDGEISLTIGEDSYVHQAREAIISIGSAPELINDRTYVPLKFFTNVAGMNNAIFFEGQIEINNFERME